MSVGKGGSFQYMVLEPLGSMWRKMKLRVLPPYITQVDSHHECEKQKCETTGEKNKAIFMTLGEETKKHKP